MKLESVGGRKLVLWEESCGYRGTEGVCQTRGPVKSRIG